MCVAVPFSMLQVKTRGDVAIYFTVQATNIAGLSTTATSDAYNLVGSPPTVGSVFDQEPSDEQQNRTIPIDQHSANKLDIDYQTSISRLRCGWKGFTHPYSSVTLQIGVGTLPNNDDTVRFHNINSSLHSQTYEISQTQLRPLTTYFCIVKATNRFGSVTASSDGVTTVSGTVKGVVHDGPGCSKPSSFYNLSGFDAWSPAPKSCASKTRNHWSLSSACLLSTRIEVLAGQWYSLTISASMSQTSRQNLTRMRVTAANSSELLTYYNLKVKTGVDSRNKISLSFRAVARHTVIALQTTDTDVVITSVTVAECKEDVDFQASSSVFASHWSIEKRFLPFITHYMWALLSNRSGELDTIVSYTNVGNVSSFSATRLNLLDSEHYIVGVQPCNPSLCFQTIFSDGFYVMSRAPLSSPLTATIASHKSSSKHTVNENSVILISNKTTVDVTIIWNPFQTFLSSGKRIVADVYAWTLRVPGTSAPLMPWRSLTSTSKVEVRMMDECTCSLINYVVIVSCLLQINDTISLKTSRRRTLLVVVRGYNQVGRHSDATAHLVMPAAHPLHDLLPVVFDVFPSKLKKTLDPITGRVLKTEVSKADEIDFTDSHHTLAAAWLWLHHARSEWTIIQNSPEWHSCNSSVNNVACGMTTKTYHIVDHVSLDHGITYYFCIKILEMTAAHRIESQLVGSVICSDGVTVDKTPPVSGDVFIGLGTHGSAYQTFTDMLMVRWRGFSDVEEMADLHSGIKEYFVALGLYASL